MNDEADVRARQQALYGASLRECVATLTTGLQLSQAALARTLGVSAPMLSQLVHAQRTKIGNPVAVQRLQSLLELAEEVASGLDADEAARRIEQIGADESTTMTRRREPVAAPDVPEALHRLLRAVASGRELQAAADALGAAHPDLAEVLRVYGTGTPARRADHYASLTDLL